MYECTYQNCHSFPGLAAPVGLSAPTLSLVNATTVLVEWSPPAQSNGMIQSYQLVLFDRTTTTTLEQGLSTSTVIYDLAPFTVYQVTITVFNTEGSVSSPAANITTGETGETTYMYCAQNLCYSSIS